MPSGAALSYAEAARRRELYPRCYRMLGTRAFEGSHNVVVRYALDRAA